MPASKLIYLLYSLDWSSSLNFFYQKAKMKKEKLRFSPISVDIAWGVRDAIVTVVGNGDGEPRSKHGRGCLHSPKTLGKIMNPPMSK